MSLFLMISGITWTLNDRLGLKAVVPRIPERRIKMNVYDGFLKVSGCKLWNTPESGEF